MRGVGLWCCGALACGPSTDVAGAPDLLVVVDHRLHLGDSVSGELVALGSAEPEAYLASAEWSPDGRYVAYAIFVGDAREIRLLDVDDGAEQVLSTRGGYQLTWAPDGSRLAYRMVREVAGADEDEYELAVVDVQGGTTRVITQTDGVTEWAPSWSPDGRWIAVSTVPTIRLYGADGTLARELDGPAGVFAWSSDGERLAYSGVGAITILDVDAEVSTRVGPEDPHGWLAWSSDHDRIAVTVTREDAGEAKLSCDLVMFGEQATQVRTLAAAEPGFCSTGLEWSPDADALLMTRGAWRGPGHEDTEDSPGELFVLSENPDGSWGARMVARASDWPDGVWGRWRPRSAAG